MIMKGNCKLQNGLNLEDLDVLEFLHGVHLDKLREELLKEKEAKINKHLKIAREWVHGIEMELNFNSTTGACAAKARGQFDYQKDKAEEQQHKAQVVAVTIAAGLYLPKFGFKDS